MWWHVDLPASLSAPEATGIPSEPNAQGEFLLEWILPTLTGELDPEIRAVDGGERRNLRRELRDDENG